MVPDKIQTGFNVVDSHDELSPEQYNFITRVMGLVLLLIKRAMITAGQVVQHRGEKIVGPEDVNKALMHEAMVFFESETLDQDLDEMVKQLQEFVEEEQAKEEEAQHSSGESVSSFADSLFDSIVDDATETAGHAEPLENAEGHVCACETCCSVRNVDEAWGVWDVTGDPVKEFLKEHINVMMSEGLTEIDV